MNGIIYCVHLLGVGHLKRMLLLCQELVKFSKIYLIQAGDDRGMTFEHPNFKHLVLPFSRELGRGSFEKEALADKFLNKLLTDRKKLIFSKIDFTQKFDFFITEQIPFTKLLWLNEALSIRQAIKAINPAAKILSSHKGSTRNKNILLTSAQKLEFQKADLLTVKLLEAYYDYVLVHADPNLLDFHENFFEYDQIKEKVIHTGFVSNRLKKHASINRKKNEIVIYLGSGTKLPYFLASFKEALNGLKDYQIIFIKGPMSDDISSFTLQMLENKYQNFKVITFIENFDELLLRASLLITTAGFTLINAYLTQIPTLVIPFEEEGSQNYLALKFQEKGLVNILPFRELNSNNLKKIVNETINKFKNKNIEIDTNGVINTGKFIYNLINK